MPEAETRTSLICATSQQCASPATIILLFDHIKMSPISYLVHKAFPPPRPLYGPCTLIGDGNEPQGIKRQLYKFFPPPLQTDVPWYSQSLNSKIAEHGDFLSSYTGLQGEELAQHIHTIRGRVWALAPYPCIGRGWFLLPGGVSGLWVWPDVVEAARDGQTILDLGCGLGQDLRRLQAEAIGDGNKETPTTKLNLYASDVRREMWDMGCELFRDKNGNGKQQPVAAKFLCADARRVRLDGRPGASFGEGGRLEEIRGRVDVVMMSQLLDLFFWHDQLAVGRTIVELSRVGTKVVGCTFGVVEGGAGEVQREGDLGLLRMYHDVHSFGTLWWDIGESTGTSWKVEVKEVEFDQWGYDGDDIAWLKEPSPKGLKCTPTGLQFVVVREG